MQLVIAEKPSVAQSIAKVLGANNRSNSYVEGNGYLISWCFGHLAGLADADYYDQRYTKWKKEDLPIIPSSFRFRIPEDKRDQFDVLKSLMDREDVTCVINACDAGREGELIFRTVYYLAGCSKPMKRLWISSMEDDAIRDGFDHLRPGYEFDGLHKSALCRAKADWLVGINATRFFSLTYGSKLNIGRVMSPTLALLVQRESEIGAFIPENYYTVNLDYGSFTACSEKFPDKEKPNTLASACRNDDAIIQKVDTVEKAEKELEKVSITKTKQQKRQVKIQSLDAMQKNVPMSLNLIGMHVDEALIALRNYLDAALLVRYEQVNVIHGFGTGALRKAVHEYLSKSKIVVDYRLGGFNEGGAGATVVILKKK